MSGRSRAIAVYHEGAAYPRLESWARNGDSFLKKLVRKVANFVRYQRNPRSASYMEELARENFPGISEIVIVEPGGHRPKIEWDGLEELVFLWPDPTGIGWKMVEAECLRKRKDGTRVWVLNGRRRRFEFDSPIARKLRRRRLWETSLVFEVLFSILIFTIAPCLWLFDLLRGKR